MSRTTTYRRVVLDMDSSESPVHGHQEGAAYNGHFKSVCYHVLYCFNQFGDCEGALCCDRGVCIAPTGGAKC